MPHPRRFLLPALLLALPSASAASVPASLVGEWLSGAQYPASVYTQDFGGANGDARRLLLNKDGSYVYTEFESTHYPSSFGTTGYPITCQMMDVTVERGTFSVSGGKITFKTAKIDRVGAYSPDRLNNGCKRNSGIKSSKAGSGLDTLTWAVASGRLTFKTPEGSATYVRRTPTPPPPSDITAFLRGEWHNGAVSPIEYYNTATGKWAEASGTSIILKFGPNFTYERTGLTVVTTYGCTSKLLVTEKGKVTEKDNTLTFTPTTSAATGYTCTPGKVSTARNHIKPYGGLWRVRVEPNGQHTLILTTNGNELLFNRPIGTPPETTRAPGSSGAVTPPPPSGGGSPTPRAPVTTKWNARGEWDAVITTDGGTIRMRFSLDDDEPRILGSGFSGSDAVGWIQGNSETGALKIGLEVEGDREVELNVTGKFDGNSYSGRFTTTNADGESMPGGTITMTRR